MSFFTERMKKIELLVLKSDLDDVMRFLGHARCLQIVSERREPPEPSPEEHETAELLQKVQAIASFLVLGEATNPLGPAPARGELLRRARASVDALKGLVDEESGLLQRKLSLQQVADALSTFTGIRVAVRDLDRMTWLTYRTASVAPERLEALAAKLKRRALIVRLEKPGHFLAIAPRKGRWALDSEMKKSSCQDLRLPENVQGIPADALAVVRNELSALDAGLADVQRRKSAARASEGDELRFLAYHLELAASIDAAKQVLESSASVQRVTGWIPRRRFREIAEGLDRLTRGRIAIRAFDPEELPEVKSGKARVPVSTPHGPLVHSFDRLVYSYSVPSYGAVDPTPFVMVIFVLLFAIMFGDVGQGLVGLLVGLLISSGRIGAFESYRRKGFGTAFMLAGAASVIAGFFYGSVFANESLLVPVTRALTGGLTGHPLDRVISLEGFQKIILFFGIMIGLGAIINSLGLLINIVNMVRRGDWEKAFLSKTGVAGAFFFWYALSLAVRIIAGGAISPVDFTALGVPLLALFLREPIVHLAKGHKPVLAEGIFGFVMEGIAEILESIIYYVSNSVSFLRVAAFALAHTVLSSIIVLLAGMVGGAPGGILLRLLVFILGNSIIIVLEGLIVSIQVVRLHYYEFFSKFWSESGRGIFSVHPAFLRRFEVKKRFLVSLALAAASAPALFAQAEAAAAGSTAVIVKYIAAALAVGFATIAGGIAVGQIGAAAMAAMSENPDLSGKAIPFVGLAEGICLWGFIVALLILSS